MAKYKSSLRKNFLLVFFFANIVLGLLTVNNLLILGRFMDEVGNTYTQSAQLQSFLNTFEQTDLSYQDYLRSKSDVSLENYFRGADALGAGLGMFNTDIYANKMALLERDVALLTNRYLETSGEAIHAKRARDIETQNAALIRTKSIYGYIVRYVGELDQEWFKWNHEYYTQTSARVRSLQWINFCIFLLAFAGNLLFAVVFIRTTTQPLIELAKASDEVSTGNYEIAPVDICSNDEIARLTGAFNNMLRSIRDNLRQIEEKNRREIQYREHEYKMENYLQEARLINLQDQVKPHFLFNCLNTAAQLAMMEGADKACRFLEDLAVFYRYNLKDRPKDTVLRNEVELVNIYVGIMRSRFGDSFAFHSQIDEAFLYVRVPSMILQPIVENAFNHGINDMEEGGEISLSITGEQSHICVCITDNGKGVPRNIIEQVSALRGESVQENVHSGIGLANVVRRIALYYGGKGDFNIKNRTDRRGTVVSILIPLPSEEGYHDELNDRG